MGPLHVWDEWGYGIQTPFKLPLKAARGSSLDRLPWEDPLQTVHQDNPEMCWWVQSSMKNNDQLIEDSLQCLQQMLLSMFKYVFIEVNYREHYWPQLGLTVLFKSNIFTTTLSSRLVWPTCLMREIQGQCVLYGRCSIHHKHFFNEFCDPTLSQPKCLGPKNDLFSVFYYPSWLKSAGGQVLYAPRVCLYVTKTSVISIKLDNIYVERASLHWFPYS